MSDWVSSGSSATTWQHTQGVLVGQGELSEAVVAVETPVAVLYGGFPYAVMMATPMDFADFAVGFTLTEELIDRPEQITSIAIEPSAASDDGGVEMNIGLDAPSFQRFLSRRRVRGLRGHTSCGICGVEDLASLPARRSKKFPAGRPPTGEAIASAFDALREFQPLSQMTRGAHAAACCSVEGTPRLVREDVGRHNALDKLIGARLRQGIDLAQGFVVISSRCSFEMVQKAIVAGVSVLVSASAPTALAIQNARAAGLTLIAPHGNRRPMVFTDAPAKSETQKVK